MQGNIRYHIQNFSNACIAVALMVGQQNHTPISRTEPKGRYKILKGRAKRRRIHRRAQERVLYIGLVLYSEIYSSTTVNDGQTPMERLTGDTIKIS